MRHPAQPEPSPQTRGSAEKTTANMKPLVVSVEEFRRLAGNIGKTLAFALIKAGEVNRVKIRGRTAVTLESVERFIERSTEQARD